MLSLAQIQLPQPHSASRTPAIKFKPNTPKQIRQTLIQFSQPVPKYLNDKILSSEHLFDILCQIDSWYSLEAFYGPKIQNWQFPLLKSIGQIYFPRLSQLYMEGMSLCSLEGIEWVNAPNLKAIYLMGNKLVSVKSLAKTRFNLMQIIQLDGELPHSELFNLTRTKISAKARVTTEDRLSANNKDQSGRGSSRLQQIVFKLEVKPHKIQQTLSQKINKRFEALVAMNQAAKF